MDEIVVTSTARSDFDMLLLTVFGCAALLLADLCDSSRLARSVFFPVDVASASFLWRRAAFRRNVTAAFAPLPPDKCG
jgi:hypothetical protein